MRKCDCEMCVEGEGGSGLIWQFPCLIIIPVILKMMQNSETKRNTNSPSLEKNK